MLKISLTGLGMNGVRQMGHGGCCYFYSPFLQIKVCNIGSCVMNMGNNVVSFCYSSVRTQPLGLEQVSVKERGRM